MKRLMLVVSLAMFFQGCQKLKDIYYKHHPDHQPETSCRIDSIYIVNPPPFSDAAGIHYNAKGYPDYVNYTLNDEFPVNYRVQYIYDEMNRLVQEVPDFIYAGPKDVIYVYEGNSMLPIRDTIYQLYVIEIEDLYYDDAGRVNRIVKHTRPRLQDDNTDYPDQEFKYYYDIRGNRQEDPTNDQYQGIIEYTNKPSLFSLHPVWQLIHKNYSRNSVAGAAAYNEEGLPLQIKDEDSVDYPPFLYMNLWGHLLTYACE